MRVCSALPRCVLSLVGILGLVLVSTTLSSPIIIAQESAASSKETAKPSNTEGLPPLPLSPIEKAQKDGSALPISLKELTKMALQYNLDIAIQDTNEDLNQQKIRGAYGVFDPSLTSQLNVGSRKSAITQTYDASTSEPFNKSDSSNWNLTLSQPLKFGGSLQAQWNTGRTDSNSSAVAFNPSYSSGMTFTFTQPLWRNLRIDQNRVTIKLAKLDLNTSDSQFKQKVTDTISNIQSSYWDLVSAIRNYEIRRDSVKLAQINLRDNRKKVEVGTLAPIDVTDAEATAASRDVDLISAEETILRAENALRQLISNDRNGDIWKKVLVPTDLPDFREYKVDLDTAIATALKNRPELEQAQISLQRLDIQTKLYQNNRKWQVNLTSYFGTTGNAGPQICDKDASGNCLPSDPLARPPYVNRITPYDLVGGVGTAYKTLFTQGYTNWQIAFNLNIPLRNRNLDSSIAQQNIQKSQQLMTIRKTEQSIQVEVQNAIQALETNRKQVETAGVARKLSQERLNGEEKRFEAGLSQNYLVLQRQNELSSAQFSELQALIRYKQAITTLQKAMYTLLESNDFEIAKGSSSKVPDLK